MRLPSAAFWLSRGTDGTSQGGGGEEGGGPARPSSVPPARRAQGLSLCAANTLIGYQRRIPVWKERGGSREKLGCTKIAVSCYS